ncbi:MAG: F0F1 ATP synthase subunit A [Patescibacteria group bacterium]|nr:F0F1 ATP synthase subunit A [Patescibacteria group bacterium]
MLNISIQPEKIFAIGGFFVTNSLLTSWLVMIFLVMLTFFVFAGLKEVPGRFQAVVEGVVGGLYGLFESVTGERTKIYYPLVATLFIFILFLNWTEILPGVGTIGLEKVKDGAKEFIPLFRPTSADLNLTIALALVSVASIQFFGLRTLGIKYLAKFINLKNPILFFVGLLDIVSEGSRIISFAFRLFGNIFAGDVLLTVIAFLMPLFAPLPFLALELFVGFIQALVFSMLTAVFLNVATSSEH